LYWVGWHPAFECCKAQLLIQQPFVRE